MCCFAEKKAVKIFDLSDANEFEFDAESNSKITLQCGNERGASTGFSWPNATVVPWVSFKHQKRGENRDLRLDVRFHD